MMNTFYSCRGPLPSHFSIFPDSTSSAASMTVECVPANSDSIISFTNGHNGMTISITFDSDAGLYEWSSILRTILISASFTEKQIESILGLQDYDEDVE
jgi:hypothetical protein